LFANSIGVEPDELHLLYELHPKFQAFPTYPLIMGFKGTEFEVVNFYEKASARFPPGLPKIDWSRGVDGERYIEIIQPIPTTSAGKKFELRRETIGAYDKGKGLVLEEQTSLVDEKEQVYCKLVGSAFFVGQGGYGGPKGPKKPTYKGTGKPIVTTFQTTPGHALLYRLNGDYNPLHADPTIGPKMGFKGAILHGLCTYNIVAVQVLRTFGKSNPANLVSFEARFSAPVYPGDLLETSMWEKTMDGLKEVVFETCVNGKPVLSNGRAIIKIPKSNL
jgi:peroxisomal enoyl-CoA hydratase 2